MADLFGRKEKWITEEEAERQLEIIRERREARREKETEEIEKGESKKGIKRKADQIFRPKYAGVGRGPPIEESGGFCYGEDKDIEIIPTDDLNEEIENIADGTKLKIGKE